MHCIHGLLGARYGERLWSHRQRSCVWWLGDKGGALAMIYLNYFTSAVPSGVICAHQIKSPPEQRSGVLV